MQLDLGFNKLVGEIPTQLGRLNKLDFLNLAGNAGFSGCLPAEWAEIEESDLDDLALPFCEAASSSR